MKMNKLKRFYLQIYDINFLRNNLIKLNTGKKLFVKREISENTNSVWLINLRKSLKTQKYKPKPTRSIPIFKLGRNISYLGVTTTLDKVRVRKVLETSRF